MSPALQHHVVNTLGWNELRVVQEQSIEAVLEGNNLIVLAPTAGGKTEAAFFPLISQTLTVPWERLSILYLSPIKALLNNQAYRLERLFEMVGRRAAVWHGDVKAPARRRLLADPPDCLLTTPESLEVMLVSPGVEHTVWLQDVQAIVIDEVHAFAAGDRGWHLLALLQRITRIAGRDIQRIGLSATVGNPEQLAGWISSGSERPQKVVDPAGRQVREADVELDYVGDLRNAATVIHSLHQGDKRLVFCDSRARVEQLGTELRGMGTRVHVTHSSLGVDERKRAEEAFAVGRDCVIAATSALELGIDVGDLDRVIQIDASYTVSSFLQRMGRTGRRAGARSNCLFLATSDDALLRASALIGLWSEGYVEPVEAPPRPLHIFAQQLMALALQQGGATAHEWREGLSRLPVCKDQLEQSTGLILNWMLEEELLWEETGILWFGRKGEEQFGRKNYLDLVAVFSAPPLFTIWHGRTELGFVHQSSFLGRRDEGAPILLSLGGRSWRVRDIDWERRKAYVEPSKGSGRSRWLGDAQLLSYRLCQAVRAELVGDHQRPEWTRRATETMTGLRQEYGWLPGQGTCLLAGRIPGDLEWWTFAGGAANASLAASLAGLLKVESSWDNFHITLKSPPAGGEVERAITELARKPENVLPLIDQRALTGLKFSDCLPPALAEDVLCARLMDPAAVLATLQSTVETPRLSD
ncbi:DEAD/DEAH box helicase [Acidimicrobium ferrooxidans]|nr:DEAD/DEAH box helicase [Acidimicrobium ferrooxidans]